MGRSNGGNREKGREREYRAIYSQPGVVIKSVNHVQGYANSNANKVKSNKSMRKFVTLKTTNGEILEGTIFLKLAQKSAFAPCIEIREKVYFKHVKKNEEPQGKLAQIRKQPKKNIREKKGAFCVKFV